MSKKNRKNSAIFNEHFEIREPKRCKGVHCVGLGESFSTNIYLQNLASIQPRTSLLKFEGGGFSAPVISKFGQILASQQLLWQASATGPAGARRAVPGRPYTAARCTQAASRAVDEIPQISLRGRGSWAVNEGLLYMYVLKIVS